MFYLRLWIFVSSLALVQSFAPTSRGAFARRTYRTAVTEISSETSFDDTLAKSGDQLVVVDYSTTWYVLFVYDLLVVFAITVFLFNVFAIAVCSS